MTCCSKDACKHVLTNLPLLLSDNPTSLQTYMAGLEVAEFAAVMSDAAAGMAARAAQETTRIAEERAAERRAFEQQLIAETQKVGMA